MNKERLLEDIEDILDNINLEDGVLIYCENQEFFKETLSALIYKQEYPNSSLHSTHISDFTIEDIIILQEYRDYLTMM